MEDIAHQAENARFIVECAYVATNALGSFSGAEGKKQIPNTFMGAMTLPQAARWKVASDKEIASLEKHGVYKLVRITSVPNGRKVVGTRWVDKINTRVEWSCWDGHKSPGSTAVASTSTMFYYWAPTSSCWTSSRSSLRTVLR